MVLLLSDAQVVTSFIHGDFSAANFNKNLARVNRLLPNAVSGEAVRELSLTHSACYIEGQN